MLNKLKKIDYKYYIGIAVIGLAIVFGTLYLIRAPKIAEADWWNDSWYYRQQVDVYNNESTALTDFQVAVSTSTLQLASLYSDGKLNSDFSDLRFTDQNGQELKYWFESTTSTMRSVFVKLSNLPANTTSTIFMYYGNQSVSDNRVSGEEMFSFFDDFEDNSINSSKWEVGIKGDNTSGGYVEEDGQLQLTSTNNESGSAYAKTLSTFTNNFIIEWKRYDTQENYNHLSFGYGDIKGVSTDEWWYTNSEYGYMCAVQDDSRFRYRRNGSLLDLEDYIDGPDSGQWVNYKNVYDSSGNWKWYYDIGSGWTLLGIGHTDTTYLINDKYILLARGGYSGAAWGGISKFDYVRVYKTTENEPTISLTSGASEEQSEAPIAYWSFDEGYGTTAHDNTSNKNHSTLTNMTTTGTSTAWVDGKFGKALEFDGVDDYVYSELNKTDLGTNLSISMWIRPTGAQTQKVMFNIGDTIDTGTPWVYFRRSSPTTVEWYLNTDYRITQTINDDTWYYMTLTYDGTTWRAYKNGVEDDETYVGPLGSNSGNYTWFSTGYHGYFKGMIDEAKFYNYTLTPAQIKKAYSSKAKSFTNINLSTSKQDKQNQRNEGLVGFWKMDEASWGDGIADQVRDYSGLGHHGTSNNGANTTTTARYNMAGEFDGDNDYVDVGTLDAGILNKEVTISQWIKMENLYNYNGSFITGAIFPVGGGTKGLKAYFNSSGKLMFIVADGLSRDIITFNYTFSADTWYHVVLTVKMGEYKKLYVNGEYQEQVDISALTGDLNKDLTSTQIGISANPFDGLIDDTKIWDRVLTAQEISEEYNEGPAPIAYWSMDAIDGITVYDQSFGGNDGTMTSMTEKANSKPGKVGQALEFDGSDSKIDLGSAKPSDLTGDISISVWINSTSKGENSAGRIIDNGEFLIRDTANANPYYAISSDGGSTYHITALDVDYGSWQHLLITRTSAGITNAYLDGVHSGNTDGSSGTPVAGSTNTFIGNNSTGNATFDGLIDEVKIYDYILTSYQIAQEYNGGSPTHYWSFDEGEGTTAHDNTENKNHGTLTNMSTTGTSTAWVNGKFGKALRFDGDDDGVFFTEKTITATDPWTFSHWIKWDDHHSESYIFYTGGYTGHGFLLRYGSNNTFAFRDSSTAYLTFSNGSADSYYQNGWFYLTWVADGAGGLELYVNGESIGEATGAGTTAMGFDTFGSGYSSTAYVLDGSMDEVKFYNYALTAFDINKEYSSRAKSKSNLNLSQSQQDATNARVDGLVGWWKMDEASWDGTTDEVIDSSGSDNHGVSLNEATTTSTAKYGRAGEFDGDNDRVEVPYTDLPQTSERTYSWWHRVDANGTAEYSSPIAYGGYANGFRVLWYDHSNDTIHLQVTCGTDTTPTFSLDSDQVDEVGVWHHYVFTYDGAVGKFYRDSVLMDTETTDKGDIKTTTTNFRIAYSQYHFPGSVDEVKAWTRVLTPSEIRSEYNEGTAMIGYWSMDNISGNTIIDESVNDNNLIFTGDMTKLNNSKPGKIGQAIEFDDNTDKLYDSTVDEVITSLKGSISYWLYIDGKDNTQGPFHLYELATASDDYIRNHINVSNNFDLAIEDGGGTAKINVSYDLDLLGEFVKKWWYITWTQDGTGIKLYINSQEKTLTGTNSGDWWTDHLDEPIGLAIGYAWAAFDGKIDEVKMYDYALTPYQIAQEYNGGAPIGYWSFDEGEGDDIHDQTDNLNHGTLNLGTGGNTVTSTAWQASTDCQKGKCMDFDGTDDYVDTGLTRADLIDGNVFTVSWWAKIDLTATKCLTSFLGDWYATHVSNDYKGRYYLYNLTPAYFDSNVIVNDGEWHHFSLSYDETYVKLYVDGQLDINDNASGTLSQADVFHIGQRSDGSYNLDGTVDEFKIWNYVLTIEDVKEDYNMGKGLYFK
jgi:Concanavalin A-like lectin/glucanases superfamily/Domain of unknown function (DUF2341)